jgi:uncharacterized repeat protein (TIGR02543 family)
MLVMLAVPVAGAMPTIGHTFYGEVTIDGAPAPDGTTVSAMIGATTYLTDTVQQVTQPGQYGWARTFMMSQDDPETFPDKEGGVQGDTVDFYVNGTYAASYTYFGDSAVPANYEYVTVLNLAITTGETHSLTVTSDGCCDITVGALGTVAAGQTQVFNVAIDANVLLTATASACCQFTGWEVDSVSVGGNPINVTMNSNHTAVATCVELGPYTLTTSANPPAGGSVAGGGSYSCGQQATLTATANPGYAFTGWSGDLGGAVNPATLLMNGNKSVTANFAGNTYSLTVTSDGCCDITVGGLGTVAAGQTQVFNVAAAAVVPLTATAPACCQFTGWEVDSVAVGGNPINVTMNSNHTAVATGVGLGPYTLTASASPPAGGSVTGGGSYNCGQQATLTATAASGYTFTGWSGDLGGTTNPATLLMNGNKSVTANFVSSGTTYSLTVSSSAGGSVIAPGEGVYSFTSGTSVPLLAAPDDCCEFVNWTGPVADPSNPATTVLVNANIAVSAVFSCPVAIMEIPLAAGWNTFSVPVAMHPCVDTWGEFISANDLDIAIAYSFNADSKTWTLVNAGTALKPLDGYYIKMASAGSAQVIANGDLTSPPVKNLKTGLNFVGVASLADVDVVSYLTTVYEVANGTGYTLVINPPVNIPNDWTNNVYLRGGVVVPTMKVGESYWVTMLNPGDLVGFTSTPLP